MLFNRLFSISVFIMVIFLNIINISVVYADSSANNSPALIRLSVDRQTLYNATMGRIDNYMSLPQSERILMKMQNKTAYTGRGQQVFSPTFIPDENAGVWIKSYTLFENVPIGNGPNVSNTGYGTIAGYDSDLKHFKHGWEGGVTYHVAVLGSRENFDDVSQSNISGDTGITGALFKKNFFTALTVDVGGGNTRVNERAGTESYNSYEVAVASKTGYNIEFKKGRYILQPSFLIIYSYDNLSDSRSSATGKTIHTEPINAIAIIPGVKLIGNFAGGWQPYLNLTVTWDLMDSPLTFEEGVEHQRVNFAPFCEYGGGIQRKWKDRYTAFGQVYFRGGGRNGINLYVGLRYTLGKNPQPHPTAPK